MKEYTVKHIRKTTVLNNSSHKKYSTILKDICSEESYRKLQFSSIIIVESDY